MKNQIKFSLKPILLLFTLGFVLCIKGIPQSQHLIDSLKDVLTIAKNDTNKVKVFIAIGEQYRNNTDSLLYFYQKALEIAENIEAKKFIAQCLIAMGANIQNLGLNDKASEYIERALKISEEIGDKAKITTCYVNIGIINHERGSYDKAIEYYLKALETAKEANYVRGISLSYKSLGIAYYDQGYYDKSIDCYLKALEIFEKLGEKRNMSACYTNIGLVHYEQGSYDKAIEYLQKSLAINTELGNKRGTSICYMNFAMIYQKQNISEKAIEYYKKALKLFEEIGDKRGESNCNQNLGEICSQQGSFNRASEYYLKALKIYEDIGDKMGIAILGINIASLNISMADSVAKNPDQRIQFLNQSVLYGNESIVNAREMKLLPQIKGAANILMTAYNKLGNFKKAIEFAGILIAAQDSLFMEDKTKAIQEMSTRYETEKKQQQIELQESQLTAKDARIKQQKTFRNALIGGLAAVALIVIVIAYAYAQKRKDNKKITEQNEKIIKTNEELKELNETTTRQKDEIITSILYAQRIQSAILPPETYINELLSENFILYKPKDIVSGDFYWIRKVKHYIILASADCTGHGVPAAFMSMLGMSSLNEIVQRREVTKANEVLNELRKEIKNSLRQTGDKEETRDGMDIALCIIDTKKKIMQYSGAHNPLYLVSHNNGESELKEIKADAMPVGVHLSHDKSFTNNEIELKTGDTFYIFSDGFVDQGGGTDNARYTTARFKKTLLNIHSLTMPEQKKILEQTLIEWMGEFPQRDDILVIGARV
jgi:serine phosphatase RsbU (regulator of sigma subunit)/Tfp pilus assembly protein PilF